MGMLIVEAVIASLLGAILVCLNQILNRMCIIVEQNGEIIKQNSEAAAASRPSRLGKP